MSLKKTTLSKKLSTPVAPKKPTVLSHHGDKRVDDYFWMKDIKDPDTLKYIKAENRYTDAHLKPLKPLQEKLFKELKRTVNENETSAPTYIDNWEYFTKVKKGQQYSAYYRKPLKGGRTELVIDCNVLAKGKKYFDLGTYEVSPNHEWLAYSCDFSGNETYVVFFKNLKTGKVLKEKLEKAAGDLVWANDNQTVFYTELDESHRSLKVMRYEIGSKKTPEIVFSEEDHKHHVHVYKSSDQEWILIDSSGKVTSEVWFGSANESAPEFRCVQARIEGHEYGVDAREGLFFIRSNHKAENFRLMVTSISSPDMEYWDEFIAEEKETYFDGFLLFQNHLVLNRFHHALPDVMIYNFEKESYSKINFRESAFSLELSGNEDYRSSKLRYVLQSPVQPPLYVDYDMNTGRKKVVKEVSVKGFKPADYKCERLWVPSHDGLQIPVTLFYKRGVRRNSKNPALLYGYGSYGIILQPSFIRRSLPLLNRGFVYAIAHIRGGQELGRQWYEDGKFLKKENTFKDFISVAEWMVSEKWTTPRQLGIMGGSAGGMLMGAVLNMCPDLFGACVAHVPFVDVINTMFDESLPLTKQEYKEWGDPNDKKYYTYMKTYSPYDNIERKNYPHLLITGGLHDFRVTYWEPTKWAAKLREMKVGDSALLLKIKTSAGHFGASGRFDYLKEEAETLAFLIRYLGLPAK